MQISQVQFEKWVDEAIDDLPEKFQKRINNLAFFVRDNPSSNQLGKTDLSGKKNVLLLGLYEGYHQSKRLHIGAVLPDRITLFKKPIESFCRSKGEIKRMIFKTVRHEIAHHFGSDEKGAKKAECMDK